MSVSLRKPSYCLAFLGTQLGGDHDLEVRGKIIRRADDVTRVRVVRVIGGMTKIEYDYLTGVVVDLPTICCHYF